MSSDLCQPDLLGQALGRQAHAELGLDLHVLSSCTPPHRPRQRLLLRREQLDGAAEVAGRRDRLQHQRDAQVVLALHNHRVLGLKRRRRRDPPHRHHGAAELPRLRRRERAAGAIPL